MLEVRYNQTTKKVTGWCGDEAQFGTLPIREDEALVQLDTPIPSGSASTYLLEGAELILDPANLPVIDWKDRWLIASTATEKLDVIADFMGWK